MNTGPSVSAAKKGSIIAAADNVGSASAALLSAVERVAQFVGFVVPPADENRGKPIDGTALGHVADRLEVTEENIKRALMIVEGAEKSLRDRLEMP